MNQILVELAKVKHQDLLRETQEYRLAMNLALSGNKILYSIASKLRAWLSQLTSSNVTARGEALLHPKRYGD